jgi:hypothetical protein
LVKFSFRALDHARKYMPGHPRDLHGELFVRLDAARAGVG